VNVNAPELILEMGECPGLLARAQAGSDDAFDELMRIHERMVLRIALRILGCVEDAQDAAQEVFLRLYRNLRIFAADAEIRPWLYRVTVNACRDALRKRGRLTELSAEGLAHDGGAEERIAQEQQRALLARALERLPEKERAAIVLREYEERDTAEVARILNSTPTTVRTQISKGRAHLRDMIARLTRRKS